MLFESINKSTPLQTYTPPIDFLAPKAGAWGRRSGRSGPGSTSARTRPARPWTHPTFAQRRTRVLQHMIRTRASRPSASTAPDCCNITPWSFMNYAAANHLGFCKPFVQSSTRFHKPEIRSLMLDQYRSWITWITENIQDYCNSWTVQVTDSVQLDKKNESTNYIKNLDSGGAPGMKGQQPRMEGSTASSYDTVTTAPRMEGRLPPRMEGSAAYDDDTTARLFQATQAMSIS